MPNLQGRCALVTGAAQGIGAVYAAALAAEGASVVITDIIDSSRAVEAVTKAGGKAIGTICDVSSFAACEAMVRTAIEAFGRIDILVNNAAMFASIQRKAFEQLSTEQWDEVMAVNVRGPFNAAKAVLPEMKKRGYGKIINISSATVFSGTPGMLHYVTSKGAIVAFTRALAREVGSHGIIVNGIAPGLTMSEGLLAQREVIEPFSKVAMASRTLKREQSPDDLVGTLIYLASPASDFMTGQTIVVDGGYVMR
jgi:NAD(P)-dependent dehydrogenase (short-subunit alcohol dehydrogenase family)